MRVKRRGVILFSLLLCFFLFGLVGAADGTCEVVDAANCIENSTVMRIYDVSNAHVEAWDLNNYAKVVCCDFLNSDVHDARNIVDGEGVNRILATSDDFNAHAGVPGEDSIYAEGVYFSNLTCDGFDGVCGAGYGIEMVSLNKSDNSHVGNFSEYGIKICCKESRFGVSGSLYWVNSSLDRITTAAVGQEVYLVAEGAAGDLRFDIWDDDTLFSADDFVGYVNTEDYPDFPDSAVAKWVIPDVSDYDWVGEEELFFNVNGRPELGESDILTIDGEVVVGDVEVEIIYPACGKWFNETDGVDVRIRVKKDNGIVVASFKVWDYYREEYRWEGSFSNAQEIYEFNIADPFDGYPGNFGLFLEAYDGGVKVRDTTNIMVLEQDASGDYEDGTYVAACIDEPENFESFEDEKVHFDASSTRGVRVVSNVIEDLIPGTYPFTWNWTFYDSKNVVIGKRYLPSNSSQNCYDFDFNFTSPGYKTTELGVRL